MLSYAFSVIETIVSQAAVFIMFRKSLQLLLSVLDTMNAELTIMNASKDNALQGTMISYNSFAYSPPSLSIVNLWINKQKY